MSCGILNLHIGAFYDSSICKGTFVMVNQMKLLVLITMLK